MKISKFYRNFNPSLTFKLKGYITTAYLLVDNTPLLLMDNCNYVPDSTNSEYILNTPSTIATCTASQELYDAALQASLPLVSELAFL